MSADRPLPHSGGFAQLSDRIRACSIFPGAVNTPLMDRRAAPPDAAARAAMLQPEDVAAAVVLVATLPARALVEEIVIRPR